MSVLFLCQTLFTRPCFALWWRRRWLFRLNDLSQPGYSQSNLIGSSGSYRPLSRDFLVLPCFSYWWRNRDVLKVNRFVQPKYSQPKSPFWLVLPSASLCEQRTQHGEVTTATKLNSILYHNTPIFNYSIQYYIFCMKPITLRQLHISINLYKNEQNACYQLELFSAN